MAQPFMASVVDEGEYSLFYFDGAYSHAIVKRPGDGDFRVQEEHGGRLEAVVPEHALLEAGAGALAKLPGQALYARLDFVRDGDEFALMEAELIEPSLYFQLDKESPERFAAALARSL